MGLLESMRAGRPPLTGTASHGSSWRAGLAGGTISFPGGAHRGNDFIW